MFIPFSKNASFNSWIVEKSADKLFITDVYSAGEDKIDNVDSQIFSKTVEHNNAKYIQGSMEDCAKAVFPTLQKDDIIITLGAGTITQVGKLIEQDHNRTKISG